MVGRTRPTGDEVTIVFESVGEPVIRIVAPKDRTMLRAMVLVLARGHLAPGDKLAIVAGDETEGEDLPQVSRGSHYGADNTFLAGQHWRSWRNATVGAC